MDSYHGIMDTTPLCLFSPHLFTGTLDTAYLRLFLCEETDQGEDEHDDSVHDEPEESGGSLEGRVQRSHDHQEDRTRP